MDDKHQTVASDEKEAKQPIAMNEEEEDIEALAEPPDWLPDGWIMEVYHAEDDTINYYYTSPISNCTFSKKSEVLEYLFSRTDERILELNKFGVEKEITFQREQEWLPKGWVMEVRAGGEKMDKMYKFYVYPETGVRLLSKQDVILNEAKISQCDTNRQCDTSSKDNLLAIVDFHPSGLPEGWVKELAFRKIKEGLIRRDPYYTDPVSSYTLRTLKSVLCFIKTGKVPKRAFIQMINVHDLYSFDESAPLHESMRSRRMINGASYMKTTRPSQCRGTSQIKYSQNENSLQDSNTSTDSDSYSSYDQEEENITRRKAPCKEATSSRAMNRSTRRHKTIRIDKEMTRNQDAD